MIGGSISEMVAAPVSQPISANSLVSRNAGMQSKEALEKEIGGVPVRCRVKAKDLYGRSVSQCSLPNNQDLGHWLVQHGYAVAYRC